MGKSGKKCECEGGVPGWVVTFGDMMSLLLTFFILIVSFSSTNKAEFGKAAASIRASFGVMQRFSGVLPNPRAERSKSNMRDRTATRLKRFLQVEGVEKQVKVEYDAKGGLKISLPNVVLFEPGSATLRAEAYPVLQGIGEVLAELPDSFIEVRGHTDTAPLSAPGTYRDNYDLSYFRAYSVSDRVARSGGVPIERFEITACGPNQPLATNDTEEGRAANRRVELYVRGLVDNSKIDALRDGTGDVLGPASPAELPVSPRDLPGA